MSEDPMQELLDASFDAAGAFIAHEDECQQCQGGILCALGDQLDREHEAVIDRLATLAEQEPGWRPS